MDYKKQIERGIELLSLCNDLQTQKDGVDRPKIGEFDKSKVLDEFAMDISQASTNMTSLHMLFPLMNDLALLGRKLVDDGKLNVTIGDSLSRSALDYILEQNNLKSTRE
jgi:hypothetical protein